LDRRAISRALGYFSKKVSINKKRHYICIPNNGVP
jgi:hypothetical protein